MTTSPLRASVTVTLDGSGGAQATIGPVPVFHEWTVTRIGVSGKSAANPKVRVYRNAPMDADYIDGTSKGNLDSSDYPGTLSLSAGESLVFVWTAGTPGASCSARVEGTTNGLP